VPRPLATTSAVVGAALLGTLAHFGRRRVRAALSVAPAHPGLVDELVRQDRLRQEEIAVRLHDGPLQMVIAARQDLQEHLDGDEVDLARTAETLREAVDGLRDLNTDLYDVVLRDAGLEAALVRAANVTEGNGGPPIRIAVAPGASGPHDPLVVTAVNELLTNVRKHASASRAWVLVVGASAEAGLRVTVGDDGVGMGPEVMRDAALDGHLGLRSIERRVAEAGGSLRVRPLSPGTEIELRLPTPID
jgi:two-component system NarL family sensor kinase